MKFFTQIFLAFLAALASILLAFFLLFYYGFQNSLEKWEKVKVREIEKYAESILARNEIQVPDTLPLFVFDADKKIIFSNRGRAYNRVFPDDALYPVRPAGSGEVMGYFYTNITHFSEDDANLVFLKSFYVFFWLAPLAGFLLSIVFGLLLSKKLSAAASVIAMGLSLIAEGNLDVRIPPEGSREMQSITKSVNFLAHRIKEEQDARKRWAHDIAHDLRTPITAVRAQLEGMKDGLLAFSSERMAKNLKELERIELLINNLEELMKLESPDIKLNISRIDTRYFMKEIIDRFALELNNRHISLKTGKNIDFFKADEHLLHRAVSNIFSNATRHAEEKGRIVFTVSLEKGKIIFRIFNSGTGISETEKKRVFERLYRGDIARKSPGTGLGLSIARQVAELHGGTINIFSRPGGGTTVALSISLQDEV